MRALMLSPEPPYPLNGGGPYRTASLLHYFSHFCAVDLILISESGMPAALPAGLVRTQTVLPLPVHRKTAIARYARNARRAVSGTPPLVDRLSGLESALFRAIGSQRYEFGIVEHLWCAPYVQQLKGVCARTVLNLHNVESVLHRRCADVSRGLVRAGHTRFAEASRKIESDLLPVFTAVLTASEEDARAILRIAPGARVRVYPNALPWVEAIPRQEEPVLVFSANFEYHPNIDAVKFLLRDIWPEVRRRHPELRLRLVGRGEQAIRHLLPAEPEQQGIEFTGTVPDALAEIAKALVVLAPLRAGSGTRIKILEAWAVNRAVVATSLAAEGLKAEDGSNILLAADAADFHRAIDRLLNDPAARAIMGAKGRGTFEKLYSWNSAWAVLDEDAELRDCLGFHRYTGNS
jgi:glycosyltransferase involved in cell wall biosynthesis